MPRPSIVLIGIGTALVAGVADWITKRAFFFPGNRSIFVVPTWLVQLTDHHNFGLTFNIPFPQTFLLAITALILAILVFVLLTNKTLTVRDSLAIGLIIGGAVGNLMDRALLGFVRDWLLFFERSAVNLADGAIVLGLILILSSTVHPHLRTPPVPTIRDT